VTTLDASNDWGKPPFEWAGGSPVVWYYRYAVYREEKIKAQAK